MSSRGVPEVLMKKIDEYVDSLAPQIQPRMESELETFQQKTIDSLETQVIDAFRSLFNTNRSGNSSESSRSLNDATPDAYGGQSLPFADEIAKLTRNFGQIADEASSDLRDIFDLTEDKGTRGGPDETQSRSRGGDQSDFSRGAKGFLSAAINVVQDHLENNNQRPGGGGQRLELDGILGAISNTVKDVSRNPEETARLISPEIKEKVGAKLREQHAPIAEQFTRIALDHIKRWLRGNTSSRDIGDGVKGEIEDQVKDLVKGLGGLFGHKKQPGEGQSRGIDDRDRDRDDGGEGESSGGFSKIISDKLSTGLAKVHREVRLEFRKVLGSIEKQLFELLPDEFQRPLEKILGGNPFDSQLDYNAGSGSRTQDRGFGDDIKAKLVSKIRDLVRKVQETLRESILGVVNGGHRKFERESWIFVQTTVEQKVQRYLPKVKISVPDDIGNEGVSVGAPTSGGQLGGGSQHVPPQQQGAHSPSPSYQQQGSHVPPPSHQQQGGYAPPSSYQQQGRQEYPRQDYHSPPQGDYTSQHSHRPDGGHTQHQQYDRPPQHQSNQDYRPENRQEHQSYQGYQPPEQHNQQYQTNQPQRYQQNQGYQQNQNYQQNEGYQRDQGYQQNQDYQQNDRYNQNPRY